MIHSETIHCPFCHSDDLVKNGHNASGEQRWRCNKCKKSFQLAYKYNAWKPGIKEAIIEQTLNSSGVRDISRNLKINKNTVVSVLKKNFAREPILSHKNI
jgi:transposase-like protein